MLWQASSSLDPFASTIFTGVLPNGYGPPPGFCFDSFCGDDPFMDDKNLEDYNVDEKVSQFIKYTIDQLNYYKTKNLIMTMGSDFQYSNAHRWYKNLDKLIFYVNQMQETSDSKVNIFYSTPACYLYSLYNENTTWSTKNDDFFPYAHRPHSFWTGYFTSRTALKDFVRKTNNYLQSVRQLAALAQLNDTDTFNSLNTLERAMGVAQHHDAVSGTERQHVANDYAKRLSIGIDQCLSVIGKSFSRILEKYFGQYGDLDQAVIFCPLLNISQCQDIEGKYQYTAIVYNPLPRPIKKWIKLPVITNDCTVNEIETGTLIFSEFSTVYDETKKIPERNSQANYNLVFQSDLPALGFKLYAITKNESLLNEKNNEYEGDSVMLKNDFLQIKFDSNGNILKIDNLDTVISTPLSQKMCYYESKPGNNSISKFQASGAYIFRPLSNDPTCLNVQSFKLFNGKQFSEIHQVFNNWISQTIRLYADSKIPEFEWQVGPINIDDNVGKEVITKFQTDLKSQSLFYTDSNGREILTRKRNYRPTWQLNQTEFVSGNYYPINSRIFIRDEDSSSQVKRQLTILNDRSQGGSSINDGSIEIMLHRRVLNDDSLGVSEPLNEKGSDGNGLVVNGLYYLIFNTTQNSARIHRQNAHRINNRPLVTFGTTTKNARLLKHLSSWSPLLTNISLPLNIHLLTLLPENNQDNFESSILVRLEHFYELNEDKTFSASVIIDLKQIFGQAFNLLGVEELALGANMKVEELNNRLKWNIGNKSPNRKYNKGLKDHDRLDDFTFLFNPMQIRTFRIWYQSK